MPKIGPHSSDHAIAKLDGRTREGRLLRDMRRELVGHVGGKPSVVEMLMIERACRLRLKMMLMDARDGDTEFADRNAAAYVCWHNALIRTLARLGLKATPAASGASSFANYVASRAA